MSTEALEQERRRGRYAGAAAIAGAVILLLGWAWSIELNKNTPSGDRGLLLHFHKQPAQQVAVYATRAIALFLLSVVALHLWRATRARKPELHRALGPIGVLGPIVFGVSVMASAIGLAVVSSHYAHRASKTTAAAHDALRAPELVLSGAIGFAGELALGFWFVFVGLNAMRTGLLSRFMGVLAVIIGPIAVVMPSSLVDPVLAFWLAALGLLFLGHWPRGVPPAWSAGRSVPWPSMRHAPPAPADGASRNGEVEPVGPGVRKAREEEPSRVAAGQARRHKRKRRR